MEQYQASSATARGARRCAREGRCADALPGEDGTPAAAHAEDGLPFCRRDAAAVYRALGWMPHRYVELRIQAGDKPAATGPRVTNRAVHAAAPISLAADALIRDMVTILSSWDERIAAADNLWRPDTALSRARRDEKVIPAAVAALLPRLRQLLSLPPEPMTRYTTIRAAALAPPGTPGRVHPAADYAEVADELDGAAAGLEFLALDWQCRSRLRLTTPLADRLDGIPCRVETCFQLALEVAPEQEYRSVCTACGDLLTPSEYREWVTEYSRQAYAQVMAGKFTPVDPVTFGRLAA